MMKFSGNEDNTNKMAISISALEEKGNAIFQSLSLVIKLEDQAPIEHWTANKENILRAFRELNRAFEESNRALVMALKGEIVGKP